MFFQDEKKLSKRWKLDLGLRVRQIRVTIAISFLPGRRLIYQRFGVGLKFLYGRSFRNPSAFQLFYGDGIADAANPALRPESADTVEVDAERKLGKRMNLQASAYGYRLRNFLLGVYLPDGLLQYQNTPGIRAEGLELEINGRPTNWLEATASYALQQSRDDDCPGKLAGASGQAALRGCLWGENSTSAAECSMNPRAGRWREIP